MKVKVRVTKNDIQHGVRMSCTDCLLAKAMTRAIGSPIEIIGVGRLHGKPMANWGYRFDSLLPIGSLPEVAAALANDFDDGKPVKPLTFELDVPELQPK